MKFKYELEIDKDEIGALTDSVCGIISLMNELRDKRLISRNISAAVESQLKKASGGTFCESDDDDYSEDMEDYIGDNVNDQPDLTVHEGGLPSAEAVPLNEHQQKGKEVLGDMINEWEVGFEDPDSIQVDRAEMMKRLGDDGKKAGSVVSYCMAVGGLTIAIHEVRQETRVDADPRISRSLAAHVCQVASILLPPLADQFEYPNPYTLE
jgi:hypothetical protein